MNSLKRWQAEDKIADGTLVNDKNRFHGFPVRPVCSQNQKPVALVGKLSSEYCSVVFMRFRIADCRLQNSVSFPFPLTSI